MDKFQALEPVKLYTSLASSLPASLTSKNVTVKSKLAPQFLGRLPLDLHVLILSHLPVPDVPSYAASSRGLNDLAKDPDGLVWRCKWAELEVERLGLGKVLAELEAKQKQAKAGARDAAPPTLTVDDEFGDFEQADVLSPPQDEMGDFVGAFDSSMSFGAPRQPTHVLFDTPAPVPSKDTPRAKYIRAHVLLKPLMKLLDAPAHLVLSQLADAVAPAAPTPPSISPLLLEGQTLRLLSRFLSPGVRSVRRWDEVSFVLGLGLCPDR
jgi:recyclin-1